MNKLENIYELMGLFSAIPVGTEEVITINDVTITLSKTEDSVNMKVEKEEPVQNFDEVLKKVEEYKNNVNALDRDLFIECLDEMKENIPLAEFDYLLNLEEYDEEQAERVSELIDESALIIHHILQEYLEEVLDEYEEITDMIEKFK